MEYQDWVKQPNIKILCFHGERFIGMGEDFVTVFKRIIAYLRQLHSIGFGISNLRESIRINNRNDVNFVGNVVGGMITDIESLKCMVEMVQEVVKNALERENRREYPVVVKMFLLLIKNFVDVLKLEDLNEFSRQTYFIYNNPIFFDELDTYRFVRKVNEFRKRNIKEFDKIVRMYNRETDMTNWYHNISNYRKPYFDPDPLYDVLHYSRWYYSHSNRIIPYLRNVSEHAQDNNQHNRFLHSDQWEKELFSTFPDACCKICYEIVKYLHYNDELCRKQFKCTLMESFQRGSLGFKE